MLFGLVVCRSICLSVCLSVFVCLVVCLSSSFLSFIQSPSLVLSFLLSPRTSPWKCDSHIDLVENKSSELICIFRNAVSSSAQICPRPVLPPAGAWARP